MTAESNFDAQGDTNKLQPYYDALYKDRVANSADLTLAREIFINSSYIAYVGQETNQESGEIRFHFYVCEIDQNGWVKIKFRPHQGSDDSKTHRAVYLNLEQGISSVSEVPPLIREQAAWAAKYFEPTIQNLALPGLVELEYIVDDSTLVTTRVVVDNGSSFQKKEVIFRESDEPMNFKTWLLLQNFEILTENNIYGGEYELVEAYENAKSIVILLSSGNLVVVDAITKRVHNLNKIFQSWLIANNIKGAHKLIIESVDRITVEDEVVLRVRDLELSKVGSVVKFRLNLETGSVCAYQGGVTEEIGPQILDLVSHES